MSPELIDLFYLIAARMLADMDLVTREEFEAVRDSVAKARAEQEDLRDRVRDLMAKLAEIDPTADK